MGLLQEMQVELNPAPEKPTLGKVRYTHDAMIDMIVENPAIHQNELAQRFGFTPGWISIIVNSDAFKERLAERKAELIDPKIRASIEERAAGAAQRALDRIIERLDGPTPNAIKTADLVSIAKLMVAPKNQAPVQTQNNLYVVSLPPQAADSKSWLAGANRLPPVPGGPEVFDV